MFVDPVSNPRHSTSQCRRTPLMRPDTVRRVGGVVAFLASGRANCINGETIYIDGERPGLNYTC